MDAPIPMPLPARPPTALFLSAARANTLHISTVQPLLQPAPARLAHKTVTNAISMGLGTATLDSANPDSCSKLVRLIAPNALTGALSAIPTI